MSIKRITRRRIAAPIIGYADEASGNRTGGDVETKINPPAQGKVNGDMLSRVDTRVETKDGPGGDMQYRAGTNIETRTNTEVETRYDTGGKNAPTVNRCSI